MEKLILEQNLHRVNLLQVLGGHPAPPVQRQYFDANQRLVRTLDNSSNLDEIKYLRSTAYNLGAVINTLFFYKKQAQLSKMRNF